MDSRDTRSSDSFRVGVTGHRLLQNPHAVATKIHDVLVGILQAHPRVTVYSALAVGADTLFAESALALDIPLVAVIPFAHYEEDFESPHTLATYRRLLGSTERVVRLPHDERSDEAYRAAGIWIVEQCDVVVAIWDGCRTADLGGTADVVAFAEKIGRPLVRIDAQRMAEGGVK